ncbi:MAG: 16S rRNA (cytidine(1402)-2'-O)-methyltransferase [Pseudomonadales bacterium]|nr:16S rRNA (cytidine(1402)-2'-O)-methyltransferase [Pseudomonadales bacterium]
MSITLSSEAGTALDSGLYIVATPIGHLEDITLRAIAVLGQVDIIAAEDTRHSSRLLQKYQINTPLTPYHDHTNPTQRAKIIARLQQGHSVALISDAGTPLISDPGYRLVSEARELGIKVVPVPGACAAIAAICAAGLPSDRFLFEGFLPAKKGARLDALSARIDEIATLVYYESPRRLVDTLRDMIQIFGADRVAVIARELTKLHEQIKTGTLSELVGQVNADDNLRRGECVLLIKGCEVVRGEGLPQDAIAIMQTLIAELPLKQAARLTAQITGEKKNALYSWALSFQNDDEA